MERLQAREAKLPRRSWSLRDPLSTLGGSQHAKDKGLTHLRLPTSSAVCSLTDIYI
jgi:hypothetical protein